MDFPDPILENSVRDPLSNGGMVASVTTLFINVGLSKRPLIAGRGGLDRTRPLRPSMLSIMAVSSPHT